MPATRAATTSAIDAAALVAMYDGFGSRRAGSAGDYEAARWLADWLVLSDVAVERIAIPLDVRTTIEAAIAIDGGARIDGLPLFDAPDTPAEGIAGPLVDAAEDRTDIAFITADPGAASIKGQPLERMRRATRARALVIATEGVAGQLAPINAQFFRAPFGPPALQVAGMHREVLATAVARRAHARVVVRTLHTPASSYTLDARVGTGAPALVLLTPRTSWWESTAERAGGIVAWQLGLAHAARIGVTVRGFATCGHELGHLGLEHVLHAERELVARAPLWLHLGANLGASSDPRLTVRASAVSDAERMHELLVASGYSREHVAVEPIEQALGEARDLADRGARVLSLIGRNGHFHAPSDRWPANVDARAVASVAQAVARWIG